MAPEIHALVENTHQVQVATFENAEQDHMMADSVSEIALPDFVARTPSGRLLGESLKSGVQHPYVTFGLLFTPGVDCVVPD